LKFLLSAITTNELWTISSQCSFFVEAPDNTLDLCANMCDTMNGPPLMLICGMKTRGKRRKKNIVANLESTWPA
jgi:hypothetical protein